MFFKYTHAIEPVWNLTYLYKSQYVRHVFWLRFTQIKIGHFLLLLFFPFLTSPLYVKRSKTCFFIRFPEYYPPLSSLGFCWMGLACSSWPRDVHLTIVNVLCLSTRVYICRWGRGLVTIRFFYDCGPIAVVYLIYVMTHSYYSLMLVHTYLWVYLYISGIKTL